MPQAAPRGVRLLSTFLNVRFFQGAISASGTALSIGLLETVYSRGLSDNFQAPNKMQWMGFEWLQNAMRPQSFF